MSLSDFSQYLGFLVPFNCAEAFYVQVPATLRLVVFMLVLYTAANYTGVCSKEISSSHWWRREGCCSGHYYRTVPLGSRGACNCIEQMAIPE